MSRRSHRGQATPLVAIALLFAVLLLVPTAKLVHATRERAQARTAADAAALAGAAAGEAAAHDLARDNGAVVTAFTRSGSTVEVTVRVGDHEATARASRVVERVRTLEADLAEEQAGTGDPGS